MSEISPETTIADIFSNWPETIPVFLECHMHCVGCSLSSFYSLSKASKEYDIPIKYFLDLLNQRIAENRSGQTHL